MSNIQISENETKKKKTSFLWKQTQITNNSNRVPIEYCLIGSIRLIFVETAFVYWMVKLHFNLNFQIEWCANTWILFPFKTTLSTILTFNYFYYKFYCVEYRLCLFFCETTIDWSYQYILSQLPKLKRSKILMFINIHRATCFILNKCFFFLVLFNEWECL